MNIEKFFQTLAALIAEREGVNIKVTVKKL